MFLSNEWAACVYSTKQDGQAIAQLVGHDQRFWSGVGEVCVEICTLGGVPHLLLSSLAHMGRFRHFVPSTFVYFHFDFG
jgi:hypothetical protein